MLVEQLKQVQIHVKPFFVWLHTVLKYCKGKQNWVGLIEKKLPEKASLIQI